MPGPMDRERLVSEIEKRAPWYQRIEFPEYGVSTTDRPEWAFGDSACDNLFPGVDPDRAAQLRPAPKWKHLRPLMPSLEGKSVLEVGTSCGFFVFEMCKLGAASATGLELDPSNVERARFCADVLAADAATFVHGDLGSYSEAHDVVLLTSVHEHFLFPFYYLARALCLARETALIDTHYYVRDESESVNRLDLSYSDDGKPGGHAFHFSRAIYRDFLGMLGIAGDHCREKIFYDDGAVQRLLLCVDTRRFQRERASNDYLQPLRDVGT